MFALEKYQRGLTDKMAMNGGAAFGGFSHKAPVLSTDMRCYFGCPEGFKKDYDLRLHLKVRHKDENESELRKAHQAAEEEIALTSSSASTFQCALCPRTFNNHKTFYDHIVKRTHKTAWLEYKEKYGSCEVASAPFECKICGRVIKYTRDSITCHLKKVHAINWPIYLERLRAMRQGERPGELPNIDFFECKICNGSVKFISRAKHLKGVHKITESEYVELFAEEMGSQAKQAMLSSKTEDDTYGGRSATPPNTSNNFTRSPAPQFQNSNQSNFPSPMSNNNYSSGNNEMANGYTNGYEERGNEYNEMENRYDNAYNERETSQRYEAPQPNANQQPNYFSRPPVEAPNPMRSGFDNDIKPQLPKPPKSDIQDNTNKTCSSCNIKFETRRMFIEHCTDVHNMKFRTASGTKVTASTFNQRNQQPVELKKEFEENNRTVDPMNNYPNQNWNREGYSSFQGENHNLNQNYGMNGENRGTEEDNS